MKIYKALLFVALIAAVCSCSTTKNIDKGNTPKNNQVSNHAPKNNAVANYLKQVEANRQTAKAVTASISLDIMLKGNGVSCSGKLKMRRNDVIQLSLSVLFMEVARFEFSPKEVVIIDKFHKQYVRASYDEVSFLKNAGLDFYALQALFWNEIFVPGEKTDVPASRFSMSSAGEHTVLTIADAPKLNYEFMTLTESQLFDRLNVEGKNSSDTGQFVWTYGDFTKLSGKQFPKSMTMKVTGVGSDMECEMSLSGLSNDNNWEGHSTPSSKYSQRSAESLLKSLF